METAIILIHMAGIRRRQKCNIWRFVGNGHSMVQVSSQWRYVRILFYRTRLVQVFICLQQLDQHNTVIQPKMYLGVNWEGIMLLSHPNKELVKMFPYTDICSWSSSPAQFSIVVGGPTDSPQSNVTYPFGTTQGKVISDVVQAYIDVLLKELRPEDDDGAADSITQDTA